MAAFSDLWVSPGDLVEFGLGGEVVAWDFRDLSIGQLVTVNSHLLRPEMMGGVVKARYGCESLVCGSSPIVLTKYLIQGL